MKYLIILIINLFSASVLFGQTKTISGEIYTIDNEPIVGATIEYSSGLGIVTDSLGQFSISFVTPISEVNLKVRMLGFQDVDTLIQLGNVTTFVQFYLSKNVYNQPEIVVSANAETVYTAKDWIILDFKIHKDKSYFIYEKGRKRYLLCTTIEKGVEIDKIEVTKKYEKLHISCSDVLYLLGNLDCHEVHFISNKIHLSEPHSIDKFDQFIQPCVFKKDGKAIFKTYSNHNKRINYIRYQQGENPKLIHEIFDKQAAQTASSYYNDVIRLYHKSIGNPSKNAIDTGMDRINIIANGEWNGDLKQLIINNKIHEALSYYQNVEAQPLTTIEFIYKDNLYIADAINETIIRYSLDDNIVKMSILGWIWEEKLKIVDVLIDEFDGETLLLSNDNMLYQFVLNDNKAELKRINLLEIDESYPRCLTLYQGVFYYFHQPNFNQPYTKFEKLH